LLQSNIREKLEQLEKMEEKIGEFEVKIKNTSNDSENNNTRGLIKDGITRL
jgi:hypothetical protein